jgi:hypothetical protein
VDFIKRISSTLWWLGIILIPFVVFSIIFLFGNFGTLHARGFVFRRGVSSMGSESASSLADVGLQLARRRSPLVSNFITARTIPATVR